MRARAALLAAVMGSVAATWRRVLIACLIFVLQQVESINAEVRLTKRFVIALQVVNT